MNYLIGAYSRDKHKRNTIRRWATSFVVYVDISALSPHHASWRAYRFPWNVFSQNGTRIVNVFDKLLMTNSCYYFSFYCFKTNISHTKSSFIPSCNLKLCKAWGTLLQRITTTHHTTLPGTHNYYALHYRVRKLSPKKNLGKIKTISSSFIYTIKYITF